MTAEDRKLSEALAYATKMHDGQFRIGGAPYITHPKAVAKIVRDWGYGTDYQMTALFHDLLEDTDATEEKILALGGEKVLTAVRLLTKRPGYIMDDYVAAIRKNDIAFRVKAADRLHNLKSALCTDSSFKRRYIYETVDYYLAFSPEIPPAVKALAQSMDRKLVDLPFLYEPIESWKIK